MAEVKNGLRPIRHDLERAFANSKADLSEAQGITRRIEQHGVTILAGFRSGGESFEQ